MIWCRSHNFGLILDNKAAKPNPATATGAETTAPPVTRAATAAAGVDITEPA